MAYDDYFKLFTTKSEEEKQIGDEITKENERFENTPEYKEHWDKIKTLMKRESDVFNARLEQARLIRPTRRFSGIKPTKQKSVKTEDEEKADAIINAIEELPFGQKQRVAMTCFREEIPKDESMAIDDATLDEFHRVLVQTCIDFIKEKGLKDGYSVSFSADSLQESAEYGTWCPATDSFFEVDGLKHEPYTRENGKEAKIPYRVKIGESF